MDDSSSAAHSVELPATGVAEFDRLMVGTETYRCWVSKVESRGFRVEEGILTPGTAAEIFGYVLTIDPAQFRYVDLLHESRHLRQIERAERQGYNPFAEGRFGLMARAWFERGAYEYEQRLGILFGFSPEYLAFLAARINHYWKRSYRRELRFSLAAQAYLTGLWR